MSEDAIDFEMETPERSKIGGTPISKFEDSPIFNFMNNLSPIQPVNSSHGMQLFNSPSVTSISSIFSSPHVIQHRESRFLQRHAFADSLRHEISSDNLDENNLCPRTSDAIKPAVDQENRKIICSLNEAAVDPPEECSTHPSSLHQPIDHDCGSPSHNTSPCYGIKIRLKLDNGYTPVKVAHVDDADVEKREICATEIELREEHQAAQSTKEVGCGWDNLICEYVDDLLFDDLLIFDSSIDSENCKGQDETHEGNDVNSLICSSKSIDDMEISEKQQPEIPSGLCLQNERQYPPEGNSEVLIEQNGEQNGRTDQTPQIFLGTFQNHQVVLNDQNQEAGNGTEGCVSMDCKVESQQQRGMRRRCLTFELAGGYTKDSNLHPSASLPYDRKFTSDDKKSFSLKLRCGSSPCMLPGIGLHLNTLATTPDDGVVANPDRRFNSMPSSISTFPPITTGQYSLNKSSEVNKDQCPSANEVRDPEVTHSNNCEAAEFGVVEKSSQSSPKKKRQKSEDGKESETCKRCNCKKSKCLKLYCECFAAGIYCIEPCSCQECLNKPIHEETVLAARKQIESRNPLAFAPKVIRTSEPPQDKWEETNKTPASARHKRGCNCKKSSCLKKYCECYQEGVGCSPSCRCEGCKNAFGRKDASEELEHDEESMDVCDKQHEKPHDEQQNDLEQKKDPSTKSLIPITPSFEICRPFDKPPFLSTGKPPRSSRLFIGYPTPHTLKKCEHPHQHTTMNHCKSLAEDDTPEILRGDASPNNGVKTVSPNGKRVSPPCSRLGKSPNCKRGRKLILKSIPSFPSLNSDAATERQ